MATICVQKPPFICRLYNSAPRPFQHLLPSEVANRASLALDKRSEYVEHHWITVKILLYWIPSIFHQRCLFPRNQLSSLLAIRTDWVWKLSFGELASLRAEASLSATPSLRIGDSSWEKFFLTVKISLPITTTPMISLPITTKAMIWEFRIWFRDLAFACICLRSESACKAKAFIGASGQLSSGKHSEPLLFRD